MAVKTGSLVVSYPRIDEILTTWGKASRSGSERQKFAAASDAYDALVGLLNDTVLEARALRAEVETCVSQGLASLPASAAPVDDEYGHTDNADRCVALMAATNALGDSTPTAAEVIAYASELERYIAMGDEQDEPAPVARMRRRRGGRQ